MITMRRRIVILASLALAGCSSASVPIAAGNRPAPAVSVRHTGSERVALELSEPSYVAAIEVVYGRQLGVLIPADSSGPLPAGAHDVSLRAVGTVRGFAQSNAVRLQRFDFFGACPGGAVVYEPVVENRAASTGVESPSSSPHVELRSVPQLCEGRRELGYNAEGTFYRPWTRSSRWHAGAVIILASDEPIDSERLVENLTSVRSVYYAPDMLSEIASAAMAGHDGKWSATIARR
jgi:hypothetical protein